MESTIRNLTKSYSWGGVHFKPVKSLTNERFINV